MHSFRRIRFTILAVCTFAASTWAIPKPSTVPEPTPMQATTTKDLVKMLSSRHYRKLAIDDSLSEAYLDKYLESLDPQRMYFLSSDIKSFEKHKKQFDDDFKKGKVETGFEIYNVYRTRVLERLGEVVSYLENPKTTFVFNTDEQVELDRKEAQWPRDKQHAQALWVKRIRLNVLNQKLSGKSDKAKKVSVAPKDKGASEKAVKDLAKTTGKQSTSAAKPIEEIVEKLIKRYNNQISRIEQQNSRDIYEAVVNPLAALYDPHTSYFSPRTSENFNISMSLSLEGIGAVLQAEDEYTKVLRLVAGGPAHKQGQLSASDKIISVGQGSKGEMVDVVGWRLGEVVDLIRGKKGTKVRLEVLSGEGETEENKIIVIKRDKVKLEDQAAQKDTFEVTQGDKTYKVGVIDIPAFYLDFKAYRNRDPNYKSTTRDVRRLVQELKAENVDGIILDLRDNGGGSLQEATQLTDLFIDQGPVVQIRQSNGRVSRENRAYNKAIYSGPLVVLTNRLSASASEIFAGAIQDYKRGLIVGSQTFGKGTVQLLSRLTEGELKLTESKFYRVSGDSTQHRGVIPDIEMPILFDHEKVGESTYENALPWDQIRAAAHSKYFDIPSSLPYIDERHKERMSKDPEFEFILGQLAIAEENKERKFISLNEKKRIAEKNDFDNRRLALENKRRIAKGKKPYATYKEYQDAEDAEAKRLESLPTSERKLINVEDDGILSETGNILIDFTHAIDQKQKKLVKIP